MFLQLFSFLILEPTARDTNWHLWFGLLLKEENNHITEEHVNTAQCSEVNRHSWANRTHRSRKLPQVKWFICYGHCSFFPWCSADLTVMSVSWLPFFSFITWSVQPGGRYGEASALSPAHTHTHTQLLSHVHKANSRLPLNATDSNSTSYRNSRHQSVLLEENRIFSPVKADCVFPFRKINSSQVRSCGQVHRMEFFSKRNGKKKTHFPGPACERSTDK